MSKRKAVVDLTDDDGEVQPSVRESQSGRLFAMWTPELLGRLAHHGLLRVDYTQISALHGRWNTSHWMCANADSDSYVFHSLRTAILNNASTTVQLNAQLRQPRIHIYTPVADIKRVASCDVADFAVENGYFSPSLLDPPSMIDFYYEGMGMRQLEVRQQLEQLSPLPIALFQTICDFVGTL